MLETSTPITVAVNADFPELTSERQELPHNFVLCLFLYLTSVFVV